MSVVPNSVAEPVPVLIPAGSRDLSEIWTRDSLCISVEGVGATVLQATSGKTFAALVLELYLFRSHVAPNVPDATESPWAVTSSNGKDGKISLKPV